MKKILICCVLLLVSTAFAGSKKSKPMPLPTPDYIPAGPPEVHTLGSLWSDQGTLSDMNKDYKAHRVNDIVIIRIVEKTDATAAGQAKTSRAFGASSSATAIGGRLSLGNNLQNLLNLNSQNSLNGQATATSSTAMNTVLAGRVIQVLPNGNMVIEATRDIEINNERTTAIVHGLVRPGDVAADNSVLSSSVGDLHLQLKGKGIISESTRPPNKIVQFALRILGF